MQTTGQTRLDKYFGTPENAAAKKDARGMVLSLFPGIDLLGRGFEAEGWLVVRGPDLLWGQEIRNFTLKGNAGRFVGIIGGPPCQKFSAANWTRNKPGQDKFAEFNEFFRVVREGKPQWWLLENVNGSPDLQGSENWNVQRLMLNAREFGCAQNRPRKFHYGWRDAQGPIIPQRIIQTKEWARCALASEGRKGNRRTWKEFCQLQGLPAGFELPGWSLAAKYRAVGNGVPIPLGRALAKAIAERGGNSQRVCQCGCGRQTTEGQATATASCRKRLQRERDAAGKATAGPVTEPGWKWQT